MQVVITEKQVYVAPQYVAIAENQNKEQIDEVVEEHKEVQMK